MIKRRTPSEILLWTEKRRTPSEIIKKDTK